MKYRKLPVVIEAIKYQVELGNNRVMNWLSQQGADITNWTFHDGEITIPTLEGDMKATAGDFIIKGVKGEFYPCKPDIFAATYEPVLEEKHSRPTTCQEAMDMDAKQRARLLIETQETADRLNKLNAFMATDAFPLLPRQDKDLLYSQQRVMSEYVQILGKRLERAAIAFRHAKAEYCNLTQWTCQHCGREYHPQEGPICRNCQVQIESPSLTDAQRAVANGEHE